MEFKCPKCKYPLVGTPDECPLCHEQLKYTIQTNDDAGLNNGINLGIDPGMAVSRTGLNEVDLSKDLSKSKSKANGKIVAFNVVAWIFDLLCIAFFAFFLMFPVFKSTLESQLELNNPIYVVAWSGEDYSHVAFPAMQFGYLDYVVYYIITILRVIQMNGFNLLYITPYFFQIFIIILTVIAAILLLVKFIIDTVNLFKKELPKYIKKSTPDEHLKDPLNVVGHIISITVFFAISLYIPMITKNFEESVVFLRQDNVMLVNMTPMVYIIFINCGAIIVGAIVKAIFRSIVNPK